MNPKILVCITPQSNSARLIDSAAAAAAERGGELHILHIEKGNNVFRTADSPILLQQLFEYGAERGGVVHALCGENIPGVIVGFVQTEAITSVVFGEPPATPDGRPTIVDSIRAALPRTEVVIVRREEVSV